MNSRLQREESDRLRYLARQREEATAAAEAARIAEANARQAAEERRLRAEQDARAEEQKRLQQDEQERLVRTVLSNGAPVSLPMALIRTWTGNFSQELDKGAFGVVYKGLVISARGGAGVVAPTGGPTRHACYIAVKNFNIDIVDAVTNGGDADTGNKKDINPFIDSAMREIQVLGSFVHPNIIRLVGYSLPTKEQCRDSNVRPTHACLVYEFASRGGLHKTLQDDGAAAELSWSHRMAGLTYRGQTQLLLYDS